MNTILILIYYYFFIRVIACACFLNCLLSVGEDLFLNVKPLAFLSDLKILRAGKYVNDLFAVC